MSYRVPELLFCTNHITPLHLCRFMTGDTGFMRCFCCSFAPFRPEPQHSVSFAKNRASNKIQLDSCLMPGLCSHGGDSRTRTCDPPRVRRMLYQLSYASKNCQIAVRLPTSRRRNGDPRGNRTPVTAVKGRCLSRLTIGPYNFTEQI